MSKLILVFDLDNTLYGKEVGLWKIIDARIEDYVKDTLGADVETARNVRKGFLKIYGTTLKGLMINHGVDPAHYLTYVHDLDVEDLVKRDDALRIVLNSLPCEKYVFTNASIDYATRVISSLGVGDCFQEILDIHFMDFLAKPGLYPFRKLVSYLGVDAEKIVFFDDLVDNIKAARQLGIFSVLVSDEGKRNGADLVIRNVKELKPVLAKVRQKIMD